MTNAQLQTLAAHIRANVAVAGPLAIRNDVAIAEWYNTASTTDAWNESMTAQGLFEATDVTKYDNLTAGKRGAQDRIERYAPLDMRKASNRKALLDIWGAVDATAVLQACTRKALRGELVFTSTDKTTGTVTAKSLDVVGTIALDDISIALNRY